MKVKQLMKVFKFRPAGNGTSWIAWDPYADLKVIKRVPGTCNIFQVYSVFKGQWAEFEHIELEVFLTKALTPKSVPVSKEFQKCWDEGVEAEWFDAPPPKELNVEADLA